MSKAGDDSNSVLWALSVDEKQVCLMVFENGEAAEILMSKKVAEHLAAEITRHVQLFVVFARFGGFFI